MRVIFYSVDKTEDLRLGNSISDRNHSESLLQRGKVKSGGLGEGREGLRYKQRSGSQNVKRLPLIKENQTSQVKEFSIFPCMGRCTSLGSLRSFLWYAPWLSGASMLRSPILLFPGFPRGLGVAAVCDGLTAALCFSLESPQVSPLGWL